MLKIMAILWIGYPVRTMAQAKAPVDYVNPHIGTEKSSHFTMWEARGATFPGVLLPYGMVQITPDGYTYSDKKINSFSFLNHRSGWSSRGSFNLMAFTGNTIPPLHILSSAFHHKQETTTPYYYQVKLEDYGINAEFTATGRVGLCKFTFPLSSSAHLVLSDISDVQVIDSNKISGRSGMYYFTALFNRPFQSFGPYPQQSNGQPSAAPTRNPSVFLINFATVEQEAILVKIGFSTSSYAGVETNITKELPGWDFEHVVLRSKKIWNDKLSRIEVKTSNEKQKEIFYTALYHSLFMPVVLSDADSPKDRYTALYPWDTYRSEHPLITILDPEREGDMISSVLAAYDRTGWLPTGNMMGNHNTELILDSYVKGVKDFDITKACAAMCKSLLDSPYARREMNDFVQNGFVPANITSSVTHSLEFAYDDWAAARFLEKTGNIKKYPEAYRTLTDRAYNYKNSFDPVSDFMKAKTKAGQWTNGGYSEGTQWTYTWYVPHDVQGLINLMGGKTVFSNRLNQCFEEGHYVHDNEPPLHYAYLFDFSGQPWKTQLWSRKIVEGSYSVDPGGLPGNDDLGALSSWYVFSAMGFYPVTPGVDQYEIGSPVFEETIIHLSNGKQFVIKANHVSKENKYIRSASFNGVPLNRPWITHDEILSGKTLVFEMGPQPNKAWGSDESSRPYSMTSSKPRFIFSKLNVSAHVLKANETIKLSVRVHNESPVEGTVNFPVMIDGKAFQSVSAMLNPGEYRTIRTEITLYQQGKHTVSVPGMAAQKLEVQKTAPGFIYSDLKIPLPLLIKLSDSVHIRVKLKNGGSYSGATVAKLFVNGNEIQSRKIELKAGEEKEIQFVYVPEKEGLYRIGVANLKPEKLLVVGANEKPQHNASLLASLKALLVLDFDEEPGTTIQDFSGQNNNGIVKGKLNWVEGIFGKAIQTDASQGNYIEFPDSSSLSKAGESAELTMMAWVYPMDEQNFSDIISKGEWISLQLKGSNRLINFYANGWEGHEATADVPENWNRHWHHLAGVSDGTDYKLYVDGQLVETKKGELRDPHGETGTANYSNSSWNIGRNAGAPDRVFKGYIDDVMIFQKALDQHQIVDLMEHNEQ
jgi:predicted alpha-1,2-mannosidase